MKKLRDFLYLSKINVCERFTALTSDTTSKGVIDIYKFEERNSFFFTSKKVKNVCERFTNLTSDTTSKEIPKSIRNRKTNIVSPKCYELVFKLTF